jgi:methionyl-tRNA formyltransferase
MVLTDNEFIYYSFKKLVQQEQFSDTDFEFFFSEGNKGFTIKYTDSDFKPIDIKNRSDELLDRYQMFLSLHCKQLFPVKLVEQARCINVHPGFNPYNRGWFSQTFSIINKLPVGVTIHEMDEQVDHGSIIVQQEVEILPWNTSFDVYKKIQDLEIELLTIHLKDIIDNNYEAKVPPFEGNINFKNDFHALCKINLEKSVTFREAIDYLRAMTFAGHTNAYFYDNDGRKIFIEIKMEVENEE